MLLVCLLPMGLFAAEPLMLVKPSREIFVNFPSAILPDKAVSVFLPEPAVPLHAQYPVVYILGAVPTDRDAAQELLGRSEHKAILVGLNVTEAELADTAKIAQFFSRELVPYISTNYPTLDAPAYRVIAAKGEAGAKAMGALLARNNLFGRAVILNGTEQAAAWSKPSADLRVLAAGEQAEVAAWTESLQRSGLMYGAGFVTRLTEQTSLFDVLDLDYLFGEKASLEVVKLEGSVLPTVLHLSQSEQAHVSLTAVLQNGMRFDLVPANLRLAPPYVLWDAARGTLSPIAGASAGKVKIGAFVDKIEFRAKIKLKK